MDKLVDAAVELVEGGKLGEAVAVLQQGIDVLGAAYPGRFAGSRGAAGAGGAGAARSGGPRLPQAQGGAARFRALLSLSAAFESRAPPPPAAPRWASCTTRRPSSCSWRASPTRRRRTRRWGRRERAGPGRGRGGGKGAALL
jgi:hypothetical protein